MTRRVCSAALAGLLLIAAACTGDAPSPAPDAGASPTAASPSADPTETALPSGEPTETASPSGEPTESAPPSDPTDADEQALLDLARAEGTVSVIVEAALEGEAERGSDEHGRLVAEALDALEAELDPEHTTVTTRFERYPRLTLTVDEEGLRALFVSPRVTHVWENRSIPLE
ncbi:hypothetical protein [Promicromonospora panici]|uniref:hypothetical protein n=1 Tax=Promicromonospora panici TaxID=2219658 RepID=UPI00101DB4AA|nr:hypothetical protein [Promicromonospora panici]